MITNRSCHVAIVGRTITVWEAIEKRSHELIYKTYTKFEAKGLIATTLLLQSWKSDNLRGSNGIQNKESV